MDVLSEIAYLVVIGFIAGWIAATITGERRRYGMVGYVVVGVIGAIAGNYVFASLDLPRADPALRLVAAVAGAVVLVLVLRLLRR